MLYFPSPAARGIGLIGKRPPTGQDGARCAAMAVASPRWRSHRRLEVMNTYLASSLRCSLPGKAWPVPREPPWPDLTRRSIGAWDANLARFGASLGDATPLAVRSLIMLSNYFGGEPLEGHSTKAVQQRLQLPPPMCFPRRVSARKNTQKQAVDLRWWLPKGWPAAQSVCLAGVVAQGLASCAERLPCCGGRPRDGQLRRAPALLWWMPKGWPAAQSVCLAMVDAQGLSSCAERVPCCGGRPRDGQLRRACALLWWLPKGCPAALSVCLAVVAAQGMASYAERLPCCGGCPRAGQLRRAPTLLWWLPKGWPATQSAILAVVDAQGMASCA